MANNRNGSSEVKKEKRLNELLTSAMVDIYVGPDSTHWPLHERLLCYHSPFFQNVFYKQNTSSSKSNKSYGLPDEDDLPFELLVGWLYSRAIRTPSIEKDIGPLLDLYLLANKFEMEKLCDDVVDTVREYYHNTSSYPGLRRVQYIYSNTDEDNAMREMMVNSIARQLTTASQIPSHWASALRRDGQLAVDIIRSIQQWHIEEQSIPDARDRSSERGRDGHDGRKIGFSSVVEPGQGHGGMGDSVATHDTDLGVESINTEVEDHNNNSHDDEERHDAETDNDDNTEEVKSPHPSKPKSKKAQGREKEQAEE